MKSIVAPKLSNKQRFRFNVHPTIKNYGCIPATGDIMHYKRRKALKQVTVRNEPHILLRGENYPVYKFVYECVYGELPANNIVVFEISDKDEDEIISNKNTNLIDYLVCRSFKKKKVVCKKTEFKEVPNKFERKCIGCTNNKNFRQFVYLLDEELVMLNTCLECFKDKKYERSNLHFC